MIIQKIITNITNSNCIPRVNNLDMLCCTVYLIIIILLYYYYLLLVSFDLKFVFKVFFSHTTIATEATRQ